MVSGQSAFVISSVKISSATSQWSLDAWKYLPTSSSLKPTPVIIMAHGLSGNKLMALSDYAEAFSTAGYACVVFDYRRWGTSDGRPRNCLFVTEQLEDYRTIIKWARQQPEFDAQRVILWGTSFSGGHVITLASELSVNAAAAIGQCPYTGESITRLSWALLKAIALGVLDMAKQALDLAPVYIPVAAPPGAVGVLTTPDAVRGLSSIVRAQSDYPNQIAASGIFEIPFYHPGATAHKIECPLLLVVPQNDLLCSSQAALDLITKVKRGEAVRTDGGHFDLYPGSPEHGKSLKAQLKFLKEHVPVI